MVHLAQSMIPLNEEMLSIRKESCHTVSVWDTSDENRDGHYFFNSMTISSCGRIFVARVLADTNQMVKSNMKEQ